MEDNITIIMVNPTTPVCFHVYQAPSKKDSTLYFQMKVFALKRSWFFPFRVNLFQKGAS